MKTVLYMHNGSGNHGCEAIIRTSSKLIKESADTEVLLWSCGKDEDEKYGAVSNFDSVITEGECNKKNITFIMSYIKSKIKKQYQPIYEAFLKIAFKDAVAVSIGGDNYCYTYSANKAVVDDKIIRKVSRKNVFWGCSIEEEFITPEVEENLKGFDLITARDPLSYEILKRINPNTKKVADPAFLLEKKELPLPEGFLENNTVGINISPLINDYESGENIAFENYVTLINHIISTTDMNVCLVPHVVWEYNNDFIPINKLYEIFIDTG
ncbi:MAG: polysaccharide pyruvyl transferase family protein, partial [Acutalibacteraceae bacterium]